MRIGIDARAAVQVTDGIGRYALELLRAYSRRNDDHEYVVLKNPQTPASFAFDDRFREVTMAEERFGFREQVRLPRLLKGMHLDLFHSLHLGLPLGYRGASVMTVHDIFPIILPWSFGRNRLLNAVAARYLTALVNSAGRRATLVIVVSEHTRRDMLAHTTVDPERLRRVYEGIDHLPPSAVHRAVELPHVAGLARPYLLTITNFKPHKNTAIVLEAFRRARKDVPGLALGVIGKDARGFGKVLGQKALLAAEGIHLLGFVEDGALAELMASAEAFVYPSLYEGFGFPVLEALVQGAPVICSAAASLPEVGGDAVLYIDPRNAQEVAEAIVRVCRDPRLQADLKERGKRQAGTFQWEMTAAETIEIYREAIHRHATRET